MGEAGRAGWEQTSTECRVKETRNRPSITNRVIHCLEGRLESLLYTHETAGPLPSGLLDNGCKLFFFFKGKGISLYAVVQGGNSIGNRHRE